MFPPAHRRPPTAARPASWFSPADEYALRSYGYRRALPRRSDRLLIASSIGSGNGPELPTGGATIHQIEAELVEVRRQAGMGQIIRHHFRAGRSFHPRLRLQAAFDGFFASRPAAINTLGLEVLVQEVSLQPPRHPVANSDARSAYSQPADADAEGG